VLRLDKKQNRGNKMIKGKNKFKNNQEVMTALTALEIAIKNKDEFAVSMIVTRLKNVFNVEIVLTKGKK